MPPELQLDKMMNLINYIGMSNFRQCKKFDGTDFESNYKYTSYRFLQCKPYCDCTQEYTPVELEESNNNPVDDYQNMFVAIDCRCPMDQKMKCVHVVGITHDYKYFDGKVPCHILETWTKI